MITTATADDRADTTRRPAMQAGREDRSRQNHLVVVAARGRGFTTSEYAGSC